MTRTSKKLNILGLNSRFNPLTRISNTYTLKMERNDTLPHQKVSTIIDRVSAKTIVPVADNFMAESIIDAINQDYDSTADKNLCQALKTYLTEKELTNDTKNT